MKQEQPNAIVSKRPIEKETNPSTPPRVKQIYKPKEKLVEEPLEEENKHVVDKPTPTQTQHDSWAKINRNSREHRHRFHSLA